MLNTPSLPARKTRSSFFEKLPALLLALLLTSACTPALIPMPVLAPTEEPLHMAHFVVPTYDPNSTSTAFQPDPATATGTSVPPTGTSTAAPPADTPTVPPAATQAPSPQPPPSTGRSHYTFYVSLDYANRVAAVNETIQYVNNTGQTLSDLVLAVLPNLYNGCFTLVSLAEDDTELSNYSLSGQRLTVYPPAPVPPGGVATLSIGYSLDLPYKASDDTFGYVSNQLNLTNWYPFVVPYSGGWVLHDPWAFGEELVYDAVDFDVHIKVSDANVVLAASAPAEQNGDTIHYRLDAARTFVISASDSFRVDESAVGDVKILSYHFAGDGDASQAVVWMATQSLSLYQAKFAPYPYKSLSVVETYLNDGQEFDGVVFLSSTFYSDYNGSARSNLYTIGTHEIAHQWWFGLVGSDQASEPWLDEALSVYSERIFYEYNYPNYGDWWWNFRVNYFGPHGYVDSNVYAFGTFRGYVDAVYLNGANFLDDLRSRIGDDAFFAFLKDYAARFAHGQASTGGFFAVLREHTNKDFSDLLATYFQGQY